MFISGNALKGRIHTLAVRNWDMHGHPGWSTDLDPPVGAPVALDKMKLKRLSIFIL